MFKLLLLAAVIPALKAETLSAFTLLENHAELPDLKTEPIGTHAIFKKESKPEAHPVYRGAEQHQGRANIEPVRPRGPVIKYDPMLADQPSISTEANRDNRIVSFFSYFNLYFYVHFRFILRITRHCFKKNATVSFLLGILSKVTCKQQNNKRILR